MDADSVEFCEFVKRDIIMKEFAFIHQNTPKGQILIQNNYEPEKDAYRIEIKFKSKKIGATLDMGMDIQDENQANEMFENLKDLKTVMGFIDLVIPNH